jgi:AcrR family transcriptional regulator
VTSRDIALEPTRERIVVAAMESLIDSGYAATTTLRVQHRAGVSRGALLHYFPHREDLFAAAVQRLVETNLEGVRDLLTQSPPGADPISLTSWIFRTAATSAGFAAQMELWGAARTDTHLRDALREAERPALKQLRALVDEVYGPCITRLPRYPLLAELTVQVMRGLTVAAPLYQESHPPERLVAQLAELTRMVIEDGERDHCGTCHDTYEAMTTVPLSNPKEGAGHVVT